VALRIFGLVVAGLLVVPAARGASSLAPNIIVIMVDDLDAWSLARAVGAGLMPNLRTGVIHRGMTFVNSFVTNSLCCPSRATFLTGQYSHNHGVLTNGGTNGGVTLLDDRSTLATWLQAAGYRTGYIGKYLNGYGTDDVNRDGSTDIRDAQYIPPGWNAWEALLDPSTYLVYGYSFNDNGQIVTYGHAPADYQTDVLAARAVRFINASAGGTAPFFLALMPAAPHDQVWPGMPDADDVTDIWRWTIPPPPRYVDTVTLPLPEPPSFNEADISDKPPWMNPLPPLTDDDVAAVQRKYRNRIEAMRAVDDMIGSVLATLTASGQFSRTVIVFTSDNGFLLGQHRTPGKLYPYEESIRVPLTIAAPGITTGQLAGQMVLNTDLAPTIVDLARAVAQRPMDGRSLTPVLQNNTLDWRRRFLIEHWANDPPAPLDLPDFAAVRTASLVYVEHGAPVVTKEFYDLSVDPYQLASLHRDASPGRTYQRDVLAQMLTWLRTCGNGSCQAMEFYTYR
jgi:N-acetylglucosamine-6-sulfatase